MQLAASRLDHPVVSSMCMPCAPVLGASMGLSWELAGRAVRLHLPDLSFVGVSGEALSHV